MRKERKEIKKTEKKHKKEKEKKKNISVYMNVKALELNCRKREK